MTEVVKLVGVPDHQLMESPSSWLSRVALSQVVSMPELLRYLQVSDDADKDFAFVKRNFSRCARTFTAALGTFAYVDRILVQLSKIDADGHLFLLREDGSPFHRYCAACLGLDKVKYFRIEWRFKCWQWCPEHECMLQDCCPHCGCRVSLPSTMIWAGQKAQGVATLGYCLRCEGNLAENWRDVVQTASLSTMSFWEGMLLNNGRAVLAALLNGRLRLMGSDRERDLSELRRLLRAGLLPNVTFEYPDRSLLSRRFRRQPTEVQQIRTRTRTEQEKYKTP